MSTKSKNWNSSGKKKNWINSSASVEHSTMQRRFWSTQKKICAHIHSIYNNLYVISKLRRLFVATCYSINCMVCATTAQHNTNRPPFLSMRKSHVNFLCSKNWMVHFLFRSVARTNERVDWSRRQRRQRWQHMPTLCMSRFLQWRIQRAMIEKRIFKENIFVCRRNARDRQVNWELIPMHNVPK